MRTIAFVMLGCALAAAAQTPTKLGPIDVKSLAISGVNVGVPSIAGTLAHYNGTSIDWQSKGISDERDYSGADIGARVNASFVSNSTVMIPSSELPASASTLITIPKSGALIVRGSGTLTNVGIRFSDSTTDYTGVGYLECPEGATLKLANTTNVDVISQTNFSSLTGTTNQYGLSFAVIKGCIIDGNKANNLTSGYGVRLYGRGIRIEGVTVQNAKNDGYWLEGHDPASFTAAGDDDQQFILSSRAIDNGGDGFNFVTQQGWMLKGASSWGNGSWGLETDAPLFVDSFNTYLNTTGGCHVKASGGFTGTNVQCTNAAGWGLLIDTSAGASQIANANIGCNGCVGIEIKAPNQIISGSVANSNPALKINGGNVNATLNVFNNSGNLVTLTSENGPSNLNIQGDTTSNTGCFSTSPSTADTVLAKTIGGTACSTMQFPGQINAAELNLGTSKTLMSTGATCMMSAGTTCTVTVPSGSANCGAFAQGLTAYSAACSVSGTTATVTAGAANSATWLVLATN